MLRSLLSAIPGCALGALLLTGCQADHIQPKSVEGYWTLRRIEYVSPQVVSVPVEAVELQAGQLTEYANGQVLRTGSYQLGKGNTACDNEVQVLNVTWADQTTGVYRYYFDDKNNDLNFLVIDYGICAGAMRKAYKLTAPGQQ